MCHILSVLRSLLLNILNKLFVYLLLLSRYLTLVFTFLLLNDTSSTTYAHQTNQFPLLLGSKICRPQDEIVYSSRVLIKITSKR